MGYGKAEIKQNFRITLGLEDFWNHLEKCINDEIRNMPIKKIDKKVYYCDIDDVTGDEVVLSGSYDCVADIWYCHQTLESPEEREITRPLISEYIDVESIIREHIEEFAKSISMEIEEDDDMIDYLD